MCALAGPAPNYLFYMWLGRKKSSGTWPNKAGKRTEAREITRERKNETNTVKRLRMKGKLWKMRETVRVRERLVMRQRRCFKQTKP